jgi:hypothetical protein
LHVKHEKPQCVVQCKTMLGAKRQAQKCVEQAC